MDGTGVFELKLSLLAGSLAVVMVGVQANAGQQTVAQAIPDAPRPQTNLPLAGVTPGEGTTSSATDTDSSSSPSAPTSRPADATPTVTSGMPTESDQSPVVTPLPGQGAAAFSSIIHVAVNYVDIPFTVKDPKGQLLAGLTDRDIQIYENGLRQHLSFFTSDPMPMSVALVIDQSMSQDDMDRVNIALGALQDAFTQFDDVSVFAYNKSTKKITDFTGAQSPRLTQAIERSKGGGRDAMMAGSLSGPLSQTTVINDQNFDPNTAAVRNHTGMQLSPPRDTHPLNDAILAAATALSTRPIERRRVIYVISNGNEYGSQAKTPEVIKYLLRNRIEVDGTLVGDTNLQVLGFLDRMHLPLMMRDNVLVAYEKATGGNIDSEFRTGSIEKSFARVAGEARNRYTLGYYTHEPFVDGKYRKIEVVVLNHGTNLTVLAKSGYWPAAMQVRANTSAPGQ